MEITVATAQYPITEHKTFDHWRSHTERWVAEAAQKGAQLLLFPEYGSMELVSVLPHKVQEDICRQVQGLEYWRNDFVSVFTELAKKYEVTIVAPSFPVQEEGNIYNRAYVFSPAGLAGYQDKFFMTRFEDEIWGVKSPPKVLTLFEASWGNFGIQICYDMEFSLGSQLLSSAGASLILTPSCTEAVRGATRVHIGARARALETQSYTVVSQTIGEAPWSPVVNVNYGFTAVYSPPDFGFPKEGIVNKKEPQTEGWLLETLDFTAVKAVRDEGKVLNFQDHQKFYPNFPDEEIKIIRKTVK